MVFKKLISITLIVILTFGCVSAVSAASKFGDVDPERYSWAVTQIEEMAEKGILNGYPDNTFKPENGISKIEAMLLISRILGINENVYSEKLDDIYSLYAEELDDLELRYKNEIAFLIYKGVFSIDEIAEVAKRDEFNSSLYRYEVAEYLTRAMGAYHTALDSDTGYADEKAIPEKSRPYVKYVKDKGIMQGMTETEFTPLYPVNRVQMAVMMYRVMNAQNLMFISAENKTVNSTEIEVKLAAGNGSYDITEAEFYVNGEIADASYIKSGANLALVFENGVLKRVETVLVIPDLASTVSGEVKEVVFGSSNRVKIIDSITGEIDTYDVLSTCEVYVDNELSTLSALRVKDNAKLYLDKNDIVFKIDIIDINAQFKDGIIDEIIIDDDLNIIIERTNGTKETYKAADDIIVKRNSKDALLKDVLEGDKVSLCTTKYNKITRLEVKSEIGNTKGKIVEIVISKNSSIVVEKNGDETRYPVNDTLKITLDGRVSTLYDLRVDMEAEITTDSGTVIEIAVASIDEVGQLSGQVELVNTAYGFINVKLSSGETKQIFVSNSTKITADGATTATKTIKNIKEGDMVVVIGKSVNGAFQATTIVILN